MNTKETITIKLLRDMSFEEVAAATGKAIGRNWEQADSYALTDFGDCARVEIYWVDGAAQYILHDTKGEAVAHLRSLGAAI